MEDRRFSNHNGRRQRAGDEALQAGLGRAQVSSAERALLLERVGSVGRLRGVRGQVRRVGHARTGQGLLEYEAQHKGGEEVPGEAHHVGKVRGPLLQRWISLVFVN